MRVLLNTEALNKIQNDSNMTDQEFADFIGVSRQQLWRAKLPPHDKRFSLGESFVAAVLNTFKQKTFEELFFLGRPSHGCDNDVKEVI